ncbi:MAG: VTT domain-containing protein [Anaerolineae bacterium]|nr:VTT domain-containing protein [Anaerolineae bacterium]
MDDQIVADGVGVMEQAEARVKKKSQLLWRFAGIVFAVALSIAIFIFRDQLRAVGNYGYLGIFLIAVIGNATIILPVPTIITAFAGGSVFNPILVGVISAAGATIGELTGYIAGRSGTAIVENQEVYDRFERWMERYGLVALFVLAAIPNPLFDVAGIIAGLSKMKVSTYLLVVCAGKIVKFLTIAYLGAGSSVLLDSLGF